MLLVVLKFIKAFVAHIFITILYLFDKSGNKLLNNWPLLFKTEIILRWKPFLHGHVHTLMINFLAKFIKEIKWLTNKCIVVANKVTMIIL